MEVKLIDGANASFKHKPSQSDKYERKTSLYEYHKIFKN